MFNVTWSIGISNDWLGRCKTKKSCKLTSKISHLVSQASDIGSEAPNFGLSNPATPRENSEVMRYFGLDVCGCDLEKKAPSDVNSGTCSG
jgi:hypothetical protein